MKELLAVFLIIFGWLASVMICVWTERDVSYYYFGMSRFEAAKLKESCEKSLPRDEKCVPKLTYEVK